MTSPLPLPAHHVMIGTPAYGGMVHISYLHALLSYTQHGIRHSLVTIGNESLITRARNSLAAMFLQRPEFSHLLYLDADVHLSAAGLARLLAADKPVIGAPVALKGRNSAGARIFNLGRCVGEDGELLLTERIGTAALLLARPAVQALADLAEREGRVYGPVNTQGGAAAARVQYDIFRVGVEDGEYLSEDYWVCHELRRLGFAIHVAPEVPTGHHGTLEV